VALTDQWGWSTKEVWKEMSTALSRHSWLFVIRGIVAIALGVLVFAYPAPTLVALIVVFASYAIFDGVLAIFGGFSAPGGPSWWLIAGGVAAIAVGILTFVQPATTAVALVLLVGIFAIATGVAELVTAATVGNLMANRWLLAISGVVAMAFGVLLIMSPGDGILSILWLIGFYAIFAGFMNIAMGFGLRDISDTVKSVETKTTTAAS
jgi:uncharacterized membrane protein HdeD (DUF308 family)